MLIANISQFIAAIAFIALMAINNIAINSTYGIYSSYGNFSTYSYYSAYNTYSIYPGFNYFNFGYKNCCIGLEIAMNFPSRSRDVQYIALSGIKFPAFHLATGLPSAATCSFLP